ncbi:MAG: replication-associated recombination protein A [Gemmiger sp.]
MEPLAQRLRPRNLDEVCGQQHLLGRDKVFRRTVESGRIPNMIFYGPSGVGKTTVAGIIAAGSGMRLHKLNGTTASTSDIKAVLGEIGTLSGSGGILLYLDEIQYFNKRQQQSLLECVEQGTVTLIASTTENPYFYVYNALLSRCTVFEFKSLTADDIERGLQNAAARLGAEEEAPVLIPQDALRYLAQSAGGDMRKALGNLEFAVTAAPVENGARTVTLEMVQQVARHTAMRYDKLGDDHYDIVSAYQKSMRGSDPDAALHYLARLLEAGDLPSACRRLMVCACEDVGLAWPQIIPIVKAAVDIANAVGLPEARIPLADAVILVATAPKSNAGEQAIDAAAADLKAGRSGPIPRQLQNKHFDGEDAAVKGQHYKYPHSYPNHWVAQQYLPDAIKDARYYQPGENKNEQAFVSYWRRIKNGET